MLDSDGHEYVCALQICTKLGIGDAFKVERRLYKKKRTVDTPDIAGSDEAAPQARKLLKGQRTPGDMDQRQYTGASGSIATESQDSTVGDTTQPKGSL